MSDPSVAKEFQQLVAPEFIARGFAKDGSKRLRRIVGDVCQVLFLHVEARLRREFMLEYCAFLVCAPHTHYSLAHGGQFPIGSRGTWYRADTAERLGQSMAQVRASVPALLDWFQASATLDGFLGTYAAPGRNGHASMTFACGWAARGDARSARPHAEQALREFEEIYSSFRAVYPHADHWAPACIKRAQSLLAAIDEGSTATLLAEWRTFTKSALKLPS